MNALAYSAVVAFGGLTLFAEALRQFSVPTKLESHDNFPILRDLELASLSTPTEYVRGFIFYVMFYLAAYAAFLASTELYSLLELASERIATAGPTGNFEGSASPTASSIGSYAKPLFISTTIVMALSFGVISKFEAWVRNISHRMAGIPRGVYRIISKLNRINYAKIGSAMTLPKLAAFDQIAGAQIGADPQDAQTKELRADLRAIDVLSPGLIGSESVKFWPQSSLNTFSNIVQRQKDLEDRVGEGIEKFGEDEIDNQQLSELVHECKNNALALFALLYIKNRNIGLTNLYSPISKIIIDLRTQKVDTIAQCIFGALIFTFFISLAGYIFVDFIYFYVFRNENGQSAFQIFSSNIKDVSQQALWFSLKISALLSIAAFLAAATRETHIEMGLWSPWVSRKTPYRRLVLTAILPALLATAAFGAIELIEYIAVPYFKNDFIITSRHMVEFIRTYVPFHFLLVVVPFFCALCIYILSNVHARSPLSRTIGIAVGFAGACFFWSLISIFMTYGFAENDETTVSVLYSIKEALLYFGATFAFFVSFAALIELTEAET